MLITTLTCLLGLAAAAPIVQKDVLDELVTPGSLDRVSNPPVQQTDIPTIYIPPQLPITPGVQPVPGGAVDGQRLGAEQAAPHSSSESQSSEQSESAETPTVLPLEAAAENSDSDSDPNTSEQTSESQDETSEDTTSEETPSPAPAQLVQQSGPDGDVGDDSHGSEEAVRRNWLHAFRRNFHQNIHGGNIVAGVAITPPAVGPVAVTVGNNPTAAPVGVTAANKPPAPSTLRPPAPPTPGDSAASESVESEEEAQLQAWRGCAETSDNGNCVPHGAAHDAGDLHHGVLQLEEHHSHMTI